MRIPVGGAAALALGDGRGALALILAGLPAAGAVAGGVAAEPPGKLREPLAVAPPLAQRIVDEVPAVIDCLPLPIDP